MSGGMVQRTVKFRQKGANTAVVQLFQRYAVGQTPSAPTKPSIPTWYRFSTRKLYTNEACTTEATPANNGGWGQTPPAYAEGTKIYVTCATAYNREDVDVIAANEWTDPVEYTADGLKTATVAIYKRSASAPVETPLAQKDAPTDGAVFTFATGALVAAAGGSLNGWSVEFPVTNGQPCYVRRATAAAITATDTISKSEWSEAVKLVEDGANGDVPMQAFKWLTISVDTNPSSIVLPTNGNYDNGWTATAPNRPTGASQYLWMTQAVKHTAKDGTVTYDNWSPAVRISGDKGDAGEDASDREFIYIRTDTYPFDGTQPKDVSRGKVHGTGDWIPKANQYTVDDYVPEGWSDTAIAIEENNRYVYAAIRTKGAGQNQQWGDFTDAFLWSNWGHQGIDGDGVQYIYKLFDHELTDAERTSNIPDNATLDSTTGEWMPSGTTGKNAGWYDDPQAPTRALPFCYCSVIKKIGGEWETLSTGKGKFGKLGLWSKWSENAIRLDIDNEMDMVQTDSALKVITARTVETIVRLWDGATEIDISGTTLTVSGLSATQESEGTGKKGRKLKFAFTAGSTISDVYEITISHTYTDGGISVPLSATFTIAASKGQPIYQLKPSHSALPCARNASTNALGNPPALSLKVVKVDGGSSSESDATSANLTALGVVVIYSTTSMPTSKTPDSTHLAWPNANSVQAANTDENVYIAMFNADDVLLDRETIPVLKDGEHGDGIVSITKTYAISAYGTNYQGIDTNPPQDLHPYSASQWSSGSPAVTEAKPYLWAREETAYKYKVQNDVRYYYQGKLGDNGIDAQDVEWAYIRTKTNAAPDVYDDEHYTDSHTPTGRDYTEDDHLPRVNGTTRNTASVIDIEVNGGTWQYPECTDDPKGVNDTWKYEWEVKRTKGDADGNGHRAWNYYQGTMTLHANLGADGESCPSYIEAKEAWSNDAETASATTSPTTDYSASPGDPGSAGYRKESDWYDSTPANTNNYAYLWRCSRLRTWDETTKTYDGGSGAWTYTRLSGTNGTSISVKGQVACVKTASSSFPTTGVSANELAIVKTQAQLYKYSGSAWEQNGPTATDGDSYTNQEDHHLWMWSTEANSGNGEWIDLGEFKGENGTTYYTHIAWASDVDTTDPWSGSLPEGQISTPTVNSASDVTDGDIAPFDGAKWMGILINTSSGPDTTHWHYYTWQYIKGSDGRNAVHLDLDNQHEDFLYDDAGVRISAQVTSQAHLYDGPDEKTTGITWSMCCGQSQGVDVWTAAGNSFTTGSIAKAKISTAGLLTIDEIYVDTARVKVRALYDGEYHYANFTGNRTSQDKYDLVLNPNAIPYNPATYTTQDIAISATRLDLQGNQSDVTFYTGSSTVPATRISNVYSKGILRLFATYVKQVAAGIYSSVTEQVTDTPFAVTADVASHNNGIYFELRKYAGYDDADSATHAIADYEDIPINKAENGNTIRQITVYKTGDTKPSAPVATTVADNATTVANGWSVAPPEQGGIEDMHVDDTGLNTDIGTMTVWADMTPSDPNYSTFGSGWRIAKGNSVATSDGRYVVDRIKFTPQTNSETLQIEIAASAEMNYDGVLVGNLNTPATSSTNWGADGLSTMGKTNKEIVSVSIAVNGHAGEECYIDIVFRKDTSTSDNSDCGYYRITSSSSSSKVWASSAILKNTVVQSPGWSEPVRWNGNDGKDGKDGNAYRVLAEYGGADVSLLTFSRNYAGADIKSTPSTYTLKLQKNNVDTPLPTGCGWYRKRGTGSWMSLSSTADTLVRSQSDILTDFSNGDYESVSYGVGTSATSVTYTKLVSMRWEVQRMLVPAGEYEDKLYERTLNTTPLVYEPGSGTYWYLVADSNNTGTTSSPNYVSPTDSGQAVWAQADEFEVVLTKMLFAEFARLGSFIVYDRYFFSQYGTLVGPNGDIIVKAGNVNSRFNGVTPIELCGNNSDNDDGKIICRVLLRSTGTSQLKVTLTPSSEPDCDWGAVGTLDSAALEGDGVTADTISDGVTPVLIKASGNEANAVNTTVTVSSGEHFFDIAYVKNVLQDENGDKATFVFEKVSGNVTWKSLTMVKSNDPGMTYSGYCQESVPYGWFDPSDPMAETRPATGYKFRPTKCINALTGEEWMAGGNVYVKKNGDVVLKNTMFADSIQSNKVDTQAVNGRRIHIEGGRLDVYNDVGTVGLSIGWDDNGDPYLTVAKVNSSGAVTGAYKLTYAGIEEASASSTQDKFTGKFIIASGGSASQVNNNTGAVTDYHFTAARNTVTGVYSNENPNGGEASSAYQTYRANQDNRYFTTNAKTSVISSSGDTYRIADGYYLAAGETYSDGSVHSRTMYSASNGILTEVGTAYYFLDVSVGMWCDADGSNGSKTFDPTRYFSPSRE